ncbi:unnamed protein product [Mucor hiemalis]
MAEDNVNTLAEKYQQIRNSSGNEEEKHTVLKALGDQLGLPGTPAADILSKLGKPDELTPSLEHSSATVQTMPGPAIPAGGASTESAAQAFYFVYNVRPKQEYLYFKIDPVKETVITSDWHKSS